MMSVLQINVYNLLYRISSLIFDSV